VLDSKEHTVIFLWDKLTINIVKYRKKILSIAVAELLG